MGILEPCNYHIIPFFGAEFGILKWNFHVLFLGYFNVNYWYKMEFYVKFSIFSFLKWNFQNINAVFEGLWDFDVLFFLIRSTAISPPIKPCSLTLGKTRTGECDIGFCFDFSLFIIHLDSFICP